MWLETSLTAELIVGKTKRYQVAYTNDTATSVQQILTQSLPGPYNTLLLCAHRLSNNFVQPYEQDGDL